MLKPNLTFVFLLSTISTFYAQDNNTKTIMENYTINKSVSNIEIDGIESVDEWNMYPSIKNFYNHDPIDIGKAKKAAEIKLTYDADMIYIYAKLFDDGERIIQSLQRDSDNAHWNSDSFTVVIDPTNEKQNGFLFGVNAGGSQFDATLSIEGSRTVYNKYWDQKWVSSVKKHNDFWITEIAIPFSSLQFRKDILNWGINFIRGDKKENQYTTWTQFPVNFERINLNYTGNLIWQEIPSSNKGFLALNPYSIFQSLKDNENINQKTKNEIDVGIDSKLRITKSLNLDLTINPDFSNVDVDQEIANITRFNLFIPEQRNFFLENGDLFSRYGANDVLPFFSRRIGLVNGKNIPISFGARVTGAIDENLRIGLMNIQTKKLDETEAQNNTVASVNYKVFDKYLVKGLFINNHETGNPDEKRFSRNYGLEFNYISKKGNFNNNFRFHTSVTDENLNNNNYFGLSGNFNTRNLGSGWTLDVVGTNYKAELGFIPRLENYNANTNETVRLGFVKFNPYIFYDFYPKKNAGKILRQRVRTWHYFFLDDKGNFNERLNNIAYDLVFKNTSILTVDTRIREVNLLFPTRLFSEQTSPLPADKYNFTRYNIDYNSDYRKKLSFGASASHGSFFNGNISSLDLSTKIRFNYFGNIEFSYAYNKIKLPDNYGKTNIHLFKFNNLLSLSNNLFFSNIVQYNSQSSNFSVFSKFQWRYSALSDIFIIYNQNNNSENFDLKNRSLILKVTYYL